MKDQWTDEYLIDQYLKNRLSEKEAMAFEERRINPEFEQQINSAQDIEIAVEELGRQNLKKRLSALDVKNQSNKGQKDEMMSQKAKPSQRRLWWFAAAAILLALVYFLLPGELPVEDYKQGLFAEFYQPFPNLVDPIVKSSGQKSDNGFQFYELKQFEKAIAIFEKKTPMNFTERLYCGLSYLSLGKGKRAAETLQPLTNESNPNFRDQVDWYYALALVSDSQFEEALALLNRIMEDQNHSYYAEAEDLFNDLH